MDAVVVERKTDQKRVHAEHVLKIADDWYRSSGPNRDGFLAPFLRQCLARLGKRRIVKRYVKCRGAREVTEFDAAVGGYAGAHEFAERIANFLRVLRTDQPERNLRHGFGGNDCLGPLARITADNAVYLGGRPRRDLLDQQATVFAGWNF